MKRSEINRAIQYSKELLKKYNIYLPPFGYWDMQEWHSNNNLGKLNTIKKVMLGWDITDYGKDSFDNLGAVLFTLRNGSHSDVKLGTPYAEKLIVLKDGQRLPLHYHADKTEDIINRAGGLLGIKLYNSDSKGEVDYHSDVDIEMDGVLHTLKAGKEILLKNGESITLRPFCFHIFYAKEGTGDVVCGEVSSINDDNIDNYNAEDVARFSTVVEDEEILHPLCNEYSKLFG
ncbi:D-lyxose/D-mannose family sugar isomerase [Pseudofrancisella aestuarii]|uniref:D-lyxose ketol-isomerase n=1 Tax=Pseudofrancisella aestuarii TaxID=2670347 RepID=A0ABV9TBJ5_9GAMM|nr:D-lyxose/D-mannose family sugar isomerase [Pseudofrancisella aestuarii]